MRATEKNEGKFEGPHRKKGGLFTAGLAVYVEELEINILKKGEGNQEVSLEC